MHELSLLETMLDQLDHMKTQYKLKTITDVTLSVGLMSGVDPGFLISTFEMYVPETRWSHLKLHLETIPWKVRCRTCLLEQVVEDWQSQCRACGSEETETIQGKDFLIQRIEGVEDDV